MDTDVIGAIIMIGAAIGAIVSVPTVLYIQSLKERTQK